MTERQVLTLFARIVAAYPHFEPHEDRIREWHRHLEKQDNERVNENLTAHIASERRMPTIADLIASPAVNMAVFAGNEAVLEVDEWERSAVPAPPETLAVLEKMRRDSNAGN